MQVLVNIFQSNFRYLHYVNSEYEASVRKQFNLKFLPELVFFDQALYYHKNEERKFVNFFVGYNLCNDSINHIITVVLSPFYNFRSQFCISIWF